MLLELGPSSVPPLRPVFTLRSLHRHSHSPSPRVRLGKEEYSKRVTNVQRLSMEAGFSAW